MVPELEKAGLSFTGKDESGQRMQVGIYSFLYDIEFFVQVFLTFIYSF